MRQHTPSPERPAAPAAVRKRRDLGRGVAPAEGRRGGLAAGPGVDSREGVRRAACCTPSELVSCNARCCLLATVIERSAGSRRGRLTTVVPHLTAAAASAAAACCLLPLPPVFPRPLLRTNMPPHTAPAPRWGRGRTGGGPPRCADHSGRRQRAQSLRPAALPAFCSPPQPSLPHTSLPSITLSSPQALQPSPQPRKHGDLLLFGCLPRRLPLPALRR